MEDGIPHRELTLKVLQYEVVCVCLAQWLSSLTFFIAVPEAPSAVDVSDILSSSANISWSPPQSDGGTPVIGYFVERSTSSSDRWVRQNREPISELIYHQDNLMEGTEYLYRVVAVNKRGESSPSLPCQPFTAKNPFSEFSLIYNDFL